ncbi:hypothetical protein BHE90_002660 [Fusarium euwallaceae]|uniref:Uncharacterized protein n=2 Tax=Fusarium solani species complex TaxID=232080 RepID=A0A430M3Y1_9HYPO|nr:hypothetical protein CEP53_004000 [Fusarium sp. AF-6]RSM13249.1 hypothetical protein CDV31_005953 [Fusarium ambrosium]RTE82717.1 hypothetical protein BHE90_002660 [Fusarium euwallaceae]
MESIALYDQVSKIISAVESTTLFTSITPRLVPQTEAASGVLARPTVTVTSESTAEGAEEHNGSGIKFIGAVEIAIAFGILVALTILVASIILCTRHRKAKKTRAAQRQMPKMMDEKLQEVAGHAPPTAARLPEAIWPRMGDKNQKVHDYWHNESSHQAQGQWNQPPQAGMQTGPPRYR